MGVTTTKTNKPFNPRGNDQSPLAYNRAALYSGKALDFDGVNDKVLIHQANDLWTGDFSVSWYGDLDATGNQFALSSGIYHGGVQAGINFWYGGSSTTDFSAHFPETDGTGQQGYNLTLGESYEYWHRIDLVFISSSRLLSLYQNGILVDTATIASNVDTAYMPNGWEFGNSYGGAYALNGKLTNLKAFNTALTAAQVKELYNNPELTLPIGVDATSLVLHLPMTEGAGSYLYNANANAIGTELISNAGFDETCQKWGTTDSSTVEISGGKAIWTNAPLAGSFVEQPLLLEAGKFYRVKFDYTSTAFNIFVNLGNTQEAVPLGNGTYVKDIYYGTGTASLKFKHGYTSDSSATVDNVSVKEVVPNYYNGSIVGATWVQSLPEPLPQTALMDWNKYQRWNGSQMVTIGSSTVQTVKHSFYARLSLEALNSDTNLGSIIFMNYQTTGTIFSIRHDAQVQLRPHCSTNGSVNLVSGATVDLGRAYDIVGVIDGSYAKIYMDGILVASTAHTQTTTPGLGGNIGAWSSSLLTTAFDGIIHQVAYFDRALTPSEIYKLYSNELKAQDISDCINSWRNLNDWKDDKGVANGTLTGTPLYGLSQIGSTAGKDVFGNTISKPRASGAYNFDGNASSVRIDKNESLNVSSLSVEAWIYPKKTGYTSIFQTGNVNGGFHYYAGVSAIGQRLYVNGSQTTTSTYLTQNAWNHIAAIHDGATTKYYLNGVLNLSTNNATSGANSMPLAQAVIGTNNVLSETIEHQSANVRLYNYALTAEQVADNFNEKASTFGGTKVASELDAYIERTASDGATVEAHSCLVNYLTELDKK